VVSAITVTLIVLAAAACVGLLLRERITLPRGLWPMAIGLVTAAAFLLEPMRQTIGFGQVNAFLMLLVLVDLLVLVPRGSRFAGIGVGLALAIKLTPGIFLLYLLLGRHWRPLITAVLSAAAVTVLAAAVASAESWRFFTSLLFDNGRVGFVGSSANQSINGLLARFVAPDAPSTAVWIAVAVVVLAAGAWRIRAAIAADDRLLAVTLTGLVGVLVSPVSWPHHIVWAMPAVIVLGAWLGRSAVDLAAQRRAGHGPTGRQLRRLAGPVTLVLTGLLIWGCDTRILFGLPDVDYSGRGPVAILLGSLPMFWVLAAVLVLPTGTRIGVDPAISPARPAAVRPAS
jgi:alpha-1,2-mannosyltransferase